jgi:hypothetical protein
LFFLPEPNYSTDFAYPSLADKLASTLRFSRQTHSINVEPSPGTHDTEPALQIVIAPTAGVRDVSRRAYVP